MAFQELLDQVGGLGKFQVLQMVLILPFAMMIICQILLENFTAAIPGHRCWVPLLDNGTVSDNDTGILSPDALLRISIPLDSYLRPEKCHRFIHPQWQLLHLNGTFTNMTEPDKETCLDGWVYDQSSFPSTIVTEWDLVCNYQSQKSIVQSLFMAGMLVGGLIGGHLSDRFGRKLILRWCLLLLTIFGTSAAFVHTFLIYCSLRFLSGCSSIIILTNGMMLIIEWVRPPSKVMAITVIFCALSVGQIVLGGLAFVFREWRTLQLVVSVPFLVFFLSSRWLVESARWLIVNNKPEEGLKALRKVAHINGMQNAGDALTMEVVFGALTAIVRSLPLLVQNHMGRRTTQTLFMFLVGLSVLVNTFVPQEMQTLRVALASMGISFAAASFTGFSVHLLELIPTVLRARALGLDTVAGRCGATVAPLLMTLMVYLPTLPWIIYGVFPIIAGLVVLFLPETRDLPLLDTIHDMKKNKEVSRKVNEINSSVRVTKI
ncbi:steroid transmembrane transporter SLC22A24-like isoform X4 [Ursus arctos]|uniref:steroid transmembrane transporter SLC22A24-like isoform X4 n=1 Tax=Ursus arctos TaxID=9644 RepID=UPI002017B85E|nr:steroid transmembrane transporter SLC22A24-like isoform X4 [Ursus arctos]